MYNNHFQNKYAGFIAFYDLLKSFLWTKCRWWNSLLRAYFVYKYTVMWCTALQLRRCRIHCYVAAPFYLLQHYTLLRPVISKAVADTLPVFFLLKMRQQATFHWRRNTVYFNLVSDVYLPLPLNPPPPIPTKEKQRRLEYEWYNIQVRWWQDVVYLNYVSLDDTSWILVKDAMPCPRDPLSEGQNVQDFSFGDTLFGDISSWHWCRGCL
jgi:hypothetical protein